MSILPKVFFSFVGFTIFVFWGLPFIGWVHLKINWHSHTEKRAEIKLPKNVEHVDVDSLVTVNGEGFDKVTVTLKPDQAEALLTEIKNKPEWHLEELKTIIKRRCGAEDDVLYEKLNQDQDAEDVNSHYQIFVYFCSRSGVLHIQESFG